MQVWGITHRGSVRQQNQDAFAAETLPDGRVIALVCDGMGGARAGNVASTMAVSLFMEQFRATDKDTAAEERMRAAARVANREIFRRSLHDEECTGMGTTLVSVLANDDEAVILNEGDSRAYHINDEGILLVTRDHSLVEDLVGSGPGPPPQEPHHPGPGRRARAAGRLFPPAHGGGGLSAAVQRRSEQRGHGAGNAL